MCFVEFFIVMISEKNKYNQHEQTFGGTVSPSKKEFTSEKSQTNSRNKIQIIVPNDDFNSIKTKDNLISDRVICRKDLIKTAKNQIKKFETDYQNLFFKQKDEFKSNFHLFDQETAPTKTENVDSNLIDSSNQSFKKKDNFKIKNYKINKENFLKLLDILGMQIQIDSDSNQKNLEQVYSTFIDEIVALGVLKEGVIHHPKETIENMDLIFNWICLNMEEINPFFVYKTLDYLHNLFNILSNNDIKINDYQANLIIPCLIKSFSDTRPYIQPAISLLIKKLCVCYDDRKIFNYLMSYIKNSNDTTRVQCLEEISFLLNTFFMESYEPEKSMNEIASLIDDANKTLGSSAMTIIAICFIKYGNDAFDYISNYDYIPMIKRHLNANYEHINELARQKISLDAQYPLVFKYISLKCKTIDQDIQEFGKIEKLSEYVKNINGRIVENCVNSLLNLGLFLMDKQKFLYLEDYVDDIMKNSSIALNKVLIEYSTNKDSLILNDLIQIIFMTVSHLFANGLGKLVGVENLKIFMFSLVIGKKILSKGDEKYRKTDLLFKNLALHSNETNCLIALFQVLNESLKKENSLLELSSYVVNIILFRLKDIEFSKLDGKMDQKLETLNQDFIEKLDPVLVLNEIHKFLEENPTLNTDLTSGMIVTAVNAILHDLVAFYGSEIFDFLDEKVSNKSQIRKKISQSFNQ